MRGTSPRMTKCMDQPDRKMRYMRQSKIATLLRGVLRGRILGAQVVRLRHRDDVVAGVDEMHLAGDAGREVGQKVKPGAAELVQGHAALERRVLLLVGEH